MFEGFTISDVGLIAPGKTVLKVGRTTDITEGEVNGYQVQVWSNGKETMEIVVLGVDPIFASQGDSGGFLAVEEMDGTRRAAGMVIGKNYQNDLVCVTPLQTIIEDSEQEFDGLRWARPL